MTQERGKDESAAAFRSGARRLDCFAKTQLVDSFAGIILECIT